jgi:CRISPR-associated endoribonuclease Cas6
LIKTRTIGASFVNTIHINSQIGRSEIRVMPHSLVLNLTPIAPIQPGYLSGKHVHALFLTIVNSVDPDLASRLHEQTTEKAFTLSPIQTGNPNRLQWQHDRPIPAGTPCWWRISLLDDALFGHLTPLWLNLNPKHSWHLGAADLHINSVLGTAQPRQPWANFASYQQLYEEASGDRTRIDLIFATPMAFRQQNFDTSLPSRDLVFKSWLKKWNQYSGREFSSDILESIFPSYFDIRTEILGDARSKFIGCVGEMTFRLMGTLEPETIKQINTLADFALYAGTGRKTPMGMGMTRRFYGK